MRSRKNEWGASVVFSTSGRQEIFGYETGKKNQQDNLITSVSVDAYNNAEWKVLSRKKARTKSLIFNIFPRFLLNFNDMLLVFLFLNSRIRWDNPDKFHTKYDKVNASWMSWKCRNGNPMPKKWEKPPKTLLAPNVHTTHFVISLD